MQYMGAVSNNRPSDIFSTGFALNPAVKAHKTIKLCLEVKHFEELKDLVVASDGRKEYSKLVAQNLYNFISSYQCDDKMMMNHSPNNYLVIPNDFLEKWMKKFEDKFRLDPDFILKTTTS